MKELVEGWVSQSGVTLNGLFSTIQDDMWAAAEEQWGFMPEVCSDGQPCRDEVWNTLTSNVKTEWQSTLNSIIVYIEMLIMRTSDLFEDAWYAAKECDHGCTLICEEQTIVYSNTIQRIKEIETQISELIREHEEEVNTYTEIRSLCPDNVDMVPVTLEHY